MPKREIAAFLLGPLVLAAILFAPPWGILAVIAIATLLAADELIGMAAANGAPTRRVLVLVLVLAVPIAGWWLGARAMLVVVVASAVIIPTIQLSHPRRPEGALGGTAVALLTVVYLGITAGCLGWLRLWPGELGIRLIIFFLIAIWLGDSGAYYIGRHLGRHRMSPKISPKKTWEGLIASIITTMLAAAAMKLIFLDDLAWLHTMAVAAILAVAGPVGDLVISQFKRDTGVKDSSNLIPGHGGLLDRTDSLFFSAPPVLGYLLLVGLIQ
jgi:phosphatidate cytidylyltransferase